MKNSVHKKTVSAHPAWMMQETVMFTGLLAAFGVQFPVFLLEFLNTAGGVDKLLLA
jgi:hypothetical protein